MSGIFVDDNDTFEVTIYYSENNKKITILEDKKEGCKSLSIIFRRPNFNMSQQILGSCTEISNNGPVVNVFKLRYSLIYFLAKSWNVKNEKNEAVELNNENIGKLKPEIVSFFIKNIQNEVGESLLAV